MNAFIERIQRCTSIEGLHHIESLVYVTPLTFSEFAEIELYLAQREEELLRGANINHI